MAACSVRSAQYGHLCSKAFYAIRPRSGLGFRRDPHDAARVVSNDAARDGVPSGCFPVRFMIAGDGNAWTEDNCDNSVLLE